MRLVTRRARSHAAPGSLTVHSMGGLGNQLFIYAAGLAAARSSGSALRVDSSLHRADVDRPFMLDRIGLPAEYCDLGESQSPPPRGCDFQESSFLFDQSAQRVEPGMCMFGYFQSWRYVEPVADELRAVLGRLNKERSENPRYAEAFERIKQQGSVVVHVRRGDYLNTHTRGWHGLAGLAFYENAVTTLRHMGHDGPILVFSDDVPATLLELAPLGCVEPAAPPGLDTVDELLLMSEARALVTANSSFSWWAGWLGEGVDRPVISPRPWFDTKDLDTRDLLPPHWLTLGR